MNKKLIIVALCSLMAYGMHAQKLTFNKEGTCKIVQFTDIHYQNGNPKSDTALLLINRVLDKEKPDMVVFTGDIVTGKPESVFQREHRRQDECGTVRAVR